MFIIPISGYAIKGEANIFTPDAFLPSPTTITQVTIQEILNQSVPTFTVKRSDGYKYLQIARDSLGGNYSGIWLGDLTTDNTNFALTGNGSSCVLNAPSGGTIKIGTNNDSCINVTGTVAATTGYLALTGKQQITGAKADEIQLKVLGHASQSANVFQITASDGSTNRLSVAASGATTITGSADAAVQLKVLASASQSASIFQVTESNGSTEKFSIAASGATTITGSVDAAIQLKVVATASQSANIFQVTGSNGTDNRFLVSSSGAITSASTLTVSSGGAGITGNSTVTGTLGITGATTITGAADAIQLKVVANATQSTYPNVFQATASNGSTNLFLVTAAGAITSGGALTVSSGGAGITGATTITGSADAVQLTVKGVLSQASSLVNFTNSVNGSMFSVSNTGATTCASTLTVSSGGAGITGATTITGSADNAIQLKVVATASQSVNIFQVLGGAVGTDNRFLVDKDGKTTSANTLTVTTGGAGITGTTTVTGALSAAGASGTITSAQKLTVTTGGADIGGNLQTIAGTITSAQKLTVTTGGADIGGNLQTIAGTITAATGLTVTAGGAGITGATTITGSADAIQLKVVANATQSTYPNVLQVFASNGSTNAFSVTAAGVGTFASNLTVSGLLYTGSGPVTLTNAAGNIVVASLVASGTNGQVLTTVGGVTAWAAGGSAVSGWTYTAGSPGTINAATPAGVNIGGYNIDASYALVCDNNAAAPIFFNGQVHIGPGPYGLAATYHINIGSYNYSQAICCVAEQTYSPGLQFKMYRPYSVASSILTEHTWVAHNSTPADFTFIKVNYDVDDNTAASEDSSIYYYVYQAGVQKIAYLSAAGVWTDASAAAGKVFVGTGKEVYGSIIEKLKGLYIGKYHAGDLKKEHHFSPTAEDFYKTFQLGIDPDNDPKGAPGIAPKDLASLALAGLVELNEKVEALQQEIAHLKGKS